MNRLRRQGACPARGAVCCDRAGAHQGAQRSEVSAGAAQAVQALPEELFGAVAQV